LVEGGEARAAIVVAPNATDTETFAARELAGYVEKITGTTLPLVATPPKGLYPLYLGAAARGRIRADWAKLGDDGFVLRSSGDGLFIAGAEDLGTLFGVYHFLEKHCGVRWFMPGEFGEVVPRTETPKIGTFDETETPDFRLRWINDGDWALRNKMNVAVEVNGKPVGVNWLWSFHTHFKLVPPDTYYDAHPDWFAMNGNGKRPRPKPGKQGQQLCTSNPAMIDEMARNIVKLLDERPDVDLLSVDPQDGGGFCQCEHCRALDEQRPEDEAWHARYSGRQFGLANELAKRVAPKHPDKLLKVGAYAMYLRVPLDPAYRPEPNLAVQVCHTYSCNNHPVESDSCRGNTKYFRKEVERWGQLTRHLLVYEYYNKGAFGGLTYWQRHVLRHDLLFYHRAGAEGFYTQGTGERWAACGLNHYLAAKLTWDLELDADKLLEDFCEKLFETAGPAMLRYFLTMERAFVDWDQCLSPYRLRWTSLVAPEIWAPEVLAELGYAMADAERAAGSDPVKQRVHLYRVNLDYTRLVIDYLTAIQAPFHGLDFGDETAVKNARAKCAEIGAPLSAKLREFCKANGLAPFDRLIAVHDMDLHYVADVPDRTPVLR
jgi:hypothetical protein